ncbi:hypothetical protein R4K92_14940 [Brachyspira intermedia]|uniref:hypothetical protein n=1 Tax=Brachyspira intermedia TaxID=84377 RepID=UPI003004385A
MAKSTDEKYWDHWLDDDPYPNIDINKIRQKNIEAGLIKPLNTEDDVVIDLKLIKKLKEELKREQEQEDNQEN